MNRAFIQLIIIICSVLSLIVTACSSQPVVNPTGTATAKIVPTSRKTSTPSPTRTPLPTPTPISLMVNGGSFGYSDTKIDTSNIWSIRRIAELGWGDPLFMVYSPDDSLLALITAGGWIRIFSLRDKREIQRIESGLPLNLEGLYFGEKCNACAGLAISPDNRLIAAASVDGTLGVWEINSGNKSVSFSSRKFNELDRNIYNQIYLTFVSDRTIGLAYDGIVSAFYDLDHRRVAEPVGYPRLAYAWGHATSSDLHDTAGVLSGVIVNNKTTDWQTWEQTRLKSWSSNPISVSPGGNFILLESLQIWNREGANVFSLSAPLQLASLERISSDYALFSDQSDLLVALVGYGKLNLQYRFDPPTMFEMETWDTNHAQQLFTTQLPQPKNNAFALSHAGSSFAYVDPNETIVILDPKTGQEQMKFDLGDVCLSTTTMITPDGSRWINYVGNVIHICDAQSGQLLNSITVPTMLILDMAMSPDGSLLASSGYSNVKLDNLKSTRDPNVYLWETSSGKLLKTLQGPTGNIRSLAFSNSGSILAAGEGTNPAKICIDRVTSAKLIFWNVADGSIVGTTQVPGGLIALTFAGDDDNYVFAIDSCANHLTWKGSIKTGTIFKTVDPRGGWVKYNSRDGVIMVESYMGYTRGYDKNTGNMLYELWDPHSIALNSDSTIMVGMAGNDQIGFWNPSNGNQFYHALAKRYYRHFVFSPDGKYMLALGMEGSTLWAIP